MTEPGLVDMFSGIAAHRKDFIDKSGRIAACSARVREAEAGLDDVATELYAIAMDMAAGLKRLSELADAAQDETELGMSVDDLAESPP